LAWVWVRTLALFDLFLLGCQSLRETLLQYTLKLSYNEQLGTDQICSFFYKVLITLRKM
jgi:hypothetical protein